MRGIEDMGFYCDTNRDGTFTGRVREFPKLCGKPVTSRLDAIDQIVSLTAQRIREIDSSRQAGKSNE